MYGEQKENSESYYSCVYVFHSGMSSIRSNLAMMMTVFTLTTEKYNSDRDFEPGRVLCPNE